MSNAWVTYLRIWNNFAKAELIPDKTTSRSRDEVKLTSPWKLVFGDGPASYQLVGGVKAYQGSDG